jgi:hypothetical protein
MEKALEDQMVNLFKVAYYMYWKERPFTDFPDQLALAHSVGGNVPDFYRSDKACARYDIIIIIILFQ